MIWHDKSVNVVMELLGTSKSGLSAEEHGRRLEEYGKNRLEEKRGKTLLERIAEQLGDFMVLTLIAAAVISFVVSAIEGENDYLDSVIILAIVAVNAVMGIVQESRAEKAIEALKRMSAPHARVRRNGKVVTVECEDIVPGDILIIETGDYIPADARILECINLKAEESSLTGESLPQEKSERAITGEAALGDRNNMLFATTLAVSGRAEAVAVETGMNTEVGKIAGMIMTDDDTKTPLQERLGEIGKILGIGAMIICGIIFVMGFMRKMPAFDMFMTSVSLAVAAIPEGLPAIVTIVLAIGVQRMSVKNAIIKKLPAVETLGSASVICSDKTGTLTQNIISVVRTECDKAGHAVSLAAQCCNGTDPTELAILKNAAGSESEAERLLEQAKRTRVKEIPFDSKRKMMTVVQKNGAGYRVISKGAPDILIEKCAVTAEEKARILGINKSMAEKGLRIIAVAHKSSDSMPRDPEQFLEFAGLIGLADPVRPEAKEAVRMCRRAGIKTVMITGDHISTACAIAGELGIMGGGDRAVTGAELAAIPQERLERDIYGYSVFARVTPEDKLRIVKTFQKAGAVVAMTGDGVNDAPALKAADIGCAMGINGTEVAKGAADIVLADDNFSTIVEAVRQGRGIYDNIRKSVHFLLSSNVGEIMTIFFAIFFGWQSPLLAIQLLWVNLVTDSLPAISLGVDSIDPDIMRKKPKNPKSGMFSDGLGLTIFLQGCIIGAVTLIAYNIGLTTAGLVCGRTMAFAVLSMSQLVHSFNVRNEKSIFKTGIGNNGMLIASFIICGIMQIGVIAVPPIATLFKVVPLTAGQWWITAMLCFVPMAVSELQKLALSLSEERSGGGAEQYYKV